MPIRSCGVPYILARRPLVSVFHEESSVCEIMRDAEVGELVTFADRDPIRSKVDAIAMVLLRAMRGETSTMPRPQSIARYSARTITGRLADIFDAAAEGRLAPSSELPLRIAAGRLRTG